jgi:hypothetical protein
MGHAATGSGGQGIDMHRLHLTVCKHSGLSRVGVSVLRDRHVGLTNGVRSSVEIGVPERRVGCDVRIRGRSWLQLAIVTSLCGSFLGVLVERIKHLDETASRVPAGLGPCSGDTAGFGESFLAFASLVVVGEDSLNLVEDVNGDFDFVGCGRVLVTGFL